MSKTSELSPMMQQYCKMKDQYKDYILMYRLGDFYEMFFDDAVLASKELDIVLTGKACGLQDNAPMCGIPFHSVDAYVSKLVSKGYKVTVCEQMKNEKTNEVIGREVVRIVTPGTVTEPSMLDESKNNYLIGVFLIQKELCFCACDVSTGEIQISKPYKKNDSSLYDELNKYSPHEIYVNNEAKADLNIQKFLKFCPQCIVTDGRIYDNSKELVEKQFNQTVSQLGISFSSLMINTLGSLLKYLYDTQLCSLSHVKDLIIVGQNDSVSIDTSTWRNLEIVESMRLKEKKGSLLGVLDKTCTAMGARLLRHFLERPSTSVLIINKRQHDIEKLFSSPIKRSDIRKNLNNIRDIDRLITKVVYGSVNPREMMNLASSFNPLPDIKKSLEDLGFGGLESEYDDLSDIEQMIKATICDDPPLAMREGGIIRDGFDAEIDQYRHMLKDSKEIIAQIESSEKQKTGIHNLKIGYNKVFGYYIEVSNSNKDSVPQNYIRKQTLVNGERFITTELKEVETKLLNANENLVKSEYKIYCNLRNNIYKSIERIRKTSEHIAYIDVICSLAECAEKNNYICPIVDNGNVIEIKDGRHPVVEDLMTDGVFIPNDAFLDTDDNRMAIITGPNMAGKSTYMRSIAIITLMAQIGSFVPASYAHICICDKIFTRVGSSDDLASGQSTFMIEMNEVAYILKHATKQSLLIFDEIGRGTSTFDGMSIARAVLEYVAKKIQSKSLFATHYHELTSLENTVEGVKNYNVAAKKRGNSVTFLRKIVAGGCDDSYGIDVARLAGIPEEVIENAEKILLELENNKNTSINTYQQKVETESQISLSLTSDLSAELINELKNTDATVLTPIESMNILYSLIKKAKEL